MTLEDHQPSEAAKRRAQRAGLDLDNLKRADPMSYMVLNAEPCARITKSYKDFIGQTMGAALPAHQFFELPSEHEWLKVLVFPVLDEATLTKLDDVLDELSKQEPLSSANAYFRIVQDQRGEQRELLLPISPEHWQGQAEVMVGPFVTQALADAYLENNLPSYPQLAFDLTVWQGKWYCDIFSAQASFL